MGFHRRKEDDLSTASVNKQTIRDQVFQILRTAILSGELEPGQRLSEPELAKQLNVSLTPVREALGSLAGSGLIERNGRRGTHVRKLRATDLDNLLSVREVLEVLAVRQAVPNLTEEDDSQLLRLLEAQRSATALAKTSPAQARAQLSALNEEFHQLILVRTGNEWLTNLLTSIQDLLVFARARLRMNATLQRRQDSLEEHRRITEALLRRDAEAAVRHMSEHLSHLKEHVVALAPDPGAKPVKTPKPQGADRSSSPFGETAASKGWGGGQKG